MKQHITGAVFAVLLVTSLALPQPTQALSCMDPAGMIEYYVDTDDYQVFTATAGEVKEYVFEEADATDPNMQFARGYTGQYVEVLESHKGWVDGELWVYYEKNSTWGYMCAGGPAEVGAETLYIVSQNSGMFELPRVVNSYPADSPLAADILAALDKAESEGGVSEVSKEDWQNRLRDQIREMIFIITIKLGELNFWAK